MAYRPASYRVGLPVRGGAFRIARLVLAGVTLIAGAGCERRTDQADYKGFVGRITAVDPAAQQFRLRTEDSSPTPTPAEFDCFVSNESEIVINDRIFSLSEVREGDEAEVIGYFLNAQRDQFAVMLMQVERPVEPVPDPELRPALTPVTPDEPDADPDADDAAPATDSAESAPQ